MRHLQFTLAVLLFFGSVFGFVQPAYSQSDLTLLLHNASVELTPDQSAHEIALFFSLLDSGGNPIRDAQTQHFTLLEDDRAVSILSVGPAEEQPISVLLLLDTSGSMAGPKIEAARSAAARFINNLQAEDRVAVLTFDRQIVTQIDFTTDHHAARQVVELIQPTPGGATCLYDAAYQAVQMLADQPSGRRALILLTDGVDDSGGGRPCSYYTADNVISLAVGEQSRVPIYTVGLGEGVDQAVLDRLARQTQGRFQYAPGPTQLEALFGRITDELRSEYVLRYQSAAQAGQHSLTLQVNYRGAYEQASLLIELPPLPYRLVFLSPAENSEIQGTARLEIQVTGQGAPIQRMLFLANGAPIGSDNEPPYETEWDPTGLPEGTVLLEAIAQDLTGTELARSAVTVIYRQAVESASPTETASEVGPTLETPIPAVTEAPSPAKKGLPLWQIMAALGGGLLLLLGIVLILMWSASRRKQEKEREQIWQQTMQAKGTAAGAAGEERTLDALMLNENAWGVLVVLQSDDPEMLHRRLEITKSVTTLGRKSDNDFVFAKDSPVSRHHAVIEERNGLLYLSEVLAADERGRSKRPAYGTFVNGMQIQEPVRLRSGDEIQLGRRLRLRFEAVRPAKGDEDRTMDQLVSSKKDETMDFIG